MLRFRLRPLLALGAIAATLALVMADADARPRAQRRQPRLADPFGAALDGDRADRASRWSAA